MIPNNNHSAVAGKTAIDSRCQSAAAGCYRRRGVTETRSPLDCRARQLHVEFPTTSRLLAVIARAATADSGRQAARAGAPRRCQNAQARLSDYAIVRMESPKNPLSNSRVVRRTDRVCRSGQSRARRHGDANVGSSQRRGVVTPSPTIATVPRDCSRSTTSAFASGGTPANTSSTPSWRSNGTAASGRSPVIRRHRGHGPASRRPTPSAGGLSPQRDIACLAVPADERRDTPVLGRTLTPGPEVGGHVEPEVVEQRLRPDDDLFPIDCRTDALARVLLELGDSRVGDRHGGRHRFGDGMVRELLDRGGSGHRPVVGPLQQFHLAGRQRARLVERDHVRVGRRLEHCVAGDDGAAVQRPADAGRGRKRRRQPQRTGTETTSTASPAASRRSALRQ